LNLTAALCHKNAKSGLLLRVLKFSGASKNKRICPSCQLLVTTYSPLGAFSGNEIADWNDVVLEWLQTSGLVFLAKRLVKKTQRKTLNLFSP
jgi:hypothetical protein